MPSRTPQSCSPYRAHPATSAAFGTRVVQLILTFILIALAGGLALAGRQAFLNRRLEYAWSSQHQIALGPLHLGQPSGSVTVLQDGEALHWALGLGAFAAMLALWALGLGLCVVTPGRQKKTLSPLGRMLTWCSFVLLLFSALNIYPPWRLDNIPFYLAGAPLILGVALAGLRSDSSWLKRVFPAAILFTVFAGWLGFDHLAVEIVISLLVSIVAAVHILILAPALQKELTKKDQKYLDQIPIDPVS